eukprot:9718620-Alexandrium_andersonii.AAC.1
MAPSAFMAPAQGQRKVWRGTWIAPVFPLRTAKPARGQRLTNAEPTTFRDCSLTPVSDTP